MYDKPDAKGIHPDEVEEAILRTRNVLTQMLLELSQGADMKCPVWDALSASLALSDLLHKFIRQEEELSDA